MADVERNSPGLYEPHAKPYLWQQEAMAAYRDGEYDAAEAAVRIANCLMLGRQRA